MSAASVPVSEPPRDLALRPPARAAAGPVPDRIEAATTCWVLTHARTRHTARPTFYAGRRGWDPDVRLAIQFVRAADAALVAQALPHGWHLIADAVEYDQDTLTRTPSGGRPSTMYQPI